MIPGRVYELLPPSTQDSWNLRAFERMAQKVRRQEQGYEYAEKLLLRLGAPALRAGADPKVWLREALETVGARNLRHRGVLRYAFKLGRTRRERADVHLARTRMPTPHGLDPVRLQGGW
jgi:hypothetical protein